MRVRYFKESASVERTLIMLAALVCMLPGCAQRCKNDAPPNIVLIVLDTVRADHLGCYGYHRGTSPRIDTFSKSATIYKTSIATSPWTVPTHASFFTGKFSFEHGAHAFKVAEGEINNANPLPTSENTLAEVFWDEGFTTGAFVANDAFLGPRWQLNQGFETYRVARVYAPELNEMVFSWLESVAHKPFFLFVNYIDAHRPYNTRPQPGLAGVPVVRDQGELLDSLYNVVMPGTGEVPEQLAQQVINQYDNAICNLDEQFGRLIDKLESHGIYENTMIVLTSDHGEFFGEHFLVEHSKDVYEEVVSVPLIIKYPQQDKGEVVATPVGSTDLPYMVLSQFTGDNWAGHLEAFPDRPGGHDVITEIYYTRTKDLFDPRWGARFDRIRTAIYEWPYKYIQSSDGKNELYNLETDKKESLNLLARDPGAGERYETKLRGFFAGRERSKELVDQKPLSEEEKKQLKSLGYIGD